MKVAIVHHYLPHYRYRIFNNLSNSKNIDVTFFSSSESFDGIKQIDCSLAKISPPNGGINWKFIHNFRFFKNFVWQNCSINVSISKEYDVVVYLGNIYHLSTWFGAIFARLSGKKVLMWTHGFLREESGFKGFIRLIFYRLANGLLLYGYRSKSILISKGYPAERLEVVYNSLDYDTQRYVREHLSNENLKQLKDRLFNNSHLPILIFIGRLTKQKKLHMVLQAANMLHQRSIPVNVLFVGEGSEINKLNDLVYEYNLEPYVVFYGETYDEKEIGSLISISDICISPGEVGLTCMHAMAYGVPVLTHDDFDYQMPEYEAILPQFTGGFFKKDNLHSLVESIENLLSRNDLDMKIHCINRIENFYNPTSQVLIIENFLNKIYTM